MALIDRETLAREVADLHEAGRDRDPRALIGWAHDLLGEDLMISTAFGKSGMAILHMVREVAPDLPIYFLDTGFHFQETLDFAERLKKEWDLNLRIHRPKLHGDAFTKEYGEKLYESNPDLCCHKNKVEPFAELVSSHQGWIAGIRRDQSSTRAEAEPVEILEGNKLKVQPLVYWTRARVEEYLAENGVPLHPLFAHGYASVGCEPCTQPSDSGDERAGRWAGKQKTECGLHLFWKKRGGRPAKPESGETDEAPAGEKRKEASPGPPDDASPESQAFSA